MLGEPDRADRPGQAEVAGLVQGFHTGVLEVLGPEDAERLLLAVAFVDLGDLDDGEGLAVLLGEERDGLGAADPLHLLLVERQRDRDRPCEPVLEVHRLQDRVVVTLALEADERRQCAHREHLEVRELAGVHDDLRQVRRLPGERPGLGALGQQIHERPAVGRDGVLRGHGSSPSVGVPGGCPRGNVATQDTDARTPRTRSGHPRYAARTRPKGPRAHPPPRP